MLLGDALQDFANTLHGLGIPAAVDTRDLNLPAAWVTPGPIDFAYLSQTSADMTADVYLIARDNGQVEALNVLGGMLAKLQAAPFAIPEATPVMIQLTNHAADALPALLLRFPLQITEETTP